LIGRWCCRARLWPCRKGAAARLCRNTNRPFLPGQARWLQGLT
jgi:hypothetical protein